MLLALVLSGCTPASYPGEKLKEALADIALKEYGITELTIEMNGTTLGVFLPLKQLFATDFKEALLSGKVTNMDQLFQPTEEAIDKVEDMLFSMSRVMRSTDKKIEFYYLQATDVEKTGMELSFLGNLNDAKKVQFWDIPRSEYRKRVMHEIQLNRAALWHKPVRRFFRDLGDKNRAHIQNEYFANTPVEKWAKEFYFEDAAGRLTETGQARWELLVVRSIPVRDSEIVVYAKVRVVPAAPGARPRTLEYLFQISTAETQEKIRRVIPMRYMEQFTGSSALPLTRQLVYESLPQWETEFKTPDIKLGDFLARQLTRRVQQDVAEDERIANTFSGVKLLFQYDSKAPELFFLSLTAPLKGVKQKVYSSGQGIHEDVVYLLAMAVREFAYVMHAYDFRSWESLEIELVEAPGYSWKVTPADLELFRKKKKPLQDLLTLTAQTSDQRLTKNKDFGLGSTDDSL